MTNPFTPSEDGLSLVDSMVQFSFLVHNALNRIGAELDLSIIQIRLLGILRDREPTMQQLAQHLGLDKSSITGLIDRAERRGLVERVVSPHDKRGFLVRLTKLGRQLIEEGEARIVQYLTEMADALSEAERSQFTSLATRMIFSAQPYSR
ncbi:MarR family winged helix-turn-helix transcriptional regulator [Paenibacillus terricola]|uniref:MarR family winged helix-turn-helix transcriptional regulator n=1 Tax=Paenibacillus terricola TaxID=2763503 RepID=UPI002963CF60|nr:MarR family transcriptional regulator [Paenibacillus terricola]